MGKTCYRPNAGPFINDFNNFRFEIKGKLDRHSAWRSGDDVWFVMYGRRDISEGAFLMRKYNQFA
jgi:hypothetical protein